MNNLYGLNDIIDSAQIILLEMRDEYKHRPSVLGFCRRLRVEHPDLSVSECFYFFELFEGWNGRPPLIDLDTGRKVP